MPHSAPLTDQPVWQLLHNCVLIRTIDKILRFNNFSDEKVHFSIGGENYPSMNPSCIDNLSAIELTHSLECIAVARDYMKLFKLILDNFI